MFGECLNYPYLCKQFPNNNQTLTKIMSSINELFKQTRLEKGWTQSQLAAAAGVGRNAVINFEAGKGVRPSTIAALRKALQL